MVDYDEILQLIQSGIYSSNNLPPKLYLDLASKLNSAIFKGWGTTLDTYTFGDPEYELLQSFSANMQRFSGAKTFQQVKEVEKIIGAAEYTEVGKQILNIYNRTWLDTEIDMVIKLSDESRNFIRYEKEKDTLPLLRFETIGDDRVRPHHRALDGIIKPVNDPFWNSYTPPLEWNCRCLLQQLESGRITPDSKIDFKEVDKEVDDVFNNNPRRTGLLFKETGKYKHPYFKGVDKEQLNNNFGFGII